MFPLLFSLLISPIIQQLHAAALPVRVLVYADYVMLLFSCCPRQAIEQLQRCLTVFQQFAPYIGLNVIFAWSYLIPKGEWNPEQKLLLALTSMQVKDSAKYLGVNLGRSPRNGPSHQPFKEPCSGH